MTNLMDLLIHTVLFQLAVGGLLVFALALLFRWVPFNASTRHSIWMLALSSIVLIPIVMILPKPELFNSNNSLLPLETAIPEKQIQEVPSGKMVTRVQRLEPTQSPSLQRGAEAVELDWFEENKLNVLSSILLFVIAISLMKLVLVVIAHFRLRKVLQQSIAVDGAVKEQVISLTQSLNMKVEVNVRSSESIQSPMAGGIFRCWILLPNSFYNQVNSSDFTQQVLLHELAHVKRRDPLWLVVQLVLSALMFWHPAIYYINRQLILERELAADDWVLDNQKENESRSNLYAKGLVQLAESIHLTRHPAMAVACVRNDRQLTVRIKKLLNQKLDHSVRGRKTTKVVVLGCVISFLLVLAPIWPQLPAANAQSQRQNIEIEKEFQSLVSIEYDTVSKQEGLTTYKGKVLLKWQGLEFEGEEIQIVGYDDYISKIKVLGTKASFESKGPVKPNFPRLIAAEINYEKSSEKVWAKDAETTVSNTMAVCGKLESSWGGNGILCSNGPRVVADLERIVNSQTMRSMSFSSAPVALAAQLFFGNVVIGDSVQSAMVFEFNSPTTKEVADYIENNSDYLVRQAGSFVVIATEENLKNIVIN